MKYGVVLLIALFPAVATAQNKTVVDSLAKSKLNDLIETWSLGIDSASDEADIKTYNKFKGLFDLSATVEDGFNALYQYKDEKSGLYKLDTRPKAFDDYAHDVALQVRNLRMNRVVLLDSNTTDPHHIFFKLLMNVDFEKAGKYVLPDAYATQVITGRNRLRFENKTDSARMVTGLNAVLNKRQDSAYKFSVEDTLQITMTADADTVRITGIKRTLGKFACTNDADSDAVTDGEDSLKNSPGDFTAAGRPDYDLDGVTDNGDKCPTTYGTTAQGCPPSYFITKTAFDVFIGLQYNAAQIKLPELNQLGYLDPSGKSATDVLQSKKGGLKSPLQVAGVYAGASYAYYFGQRKKQSGVSIGFAYSKFTAAYELVDPIVYTHKAFDGVNDYRRQITIKSLKEEVSYTAYNFPVMYSYRLRLGKNDKSVLNVKAGPSFLLFNASSTYNAVVDFGGLYQIDTARKDRIAYYDYFDPASKYNLYLTTANLQAGADSIFRQLGLKGYDFASNKTYNGSQQIKRTAVAFNLNFDWQHKISEGLTVKAGVYFVYAPSLGSKEKYKPLDRTTDEFQSIYNGNAKSTYAAVGANVGFVYNF